MLLAIVTILYITSPGPIYFIARNLNLSTPWTYFSYLFLSPSTITLSSVSMRFFSLESIYAIILFVFLWFISLNAMLWGFPGGASGKEPACHCRRHKRCGFDLWVGKQEEEGMAIHSSILAWRIPWREEPGRLQSIGLQRVGHDWSNLVCTHTVSSTSIHIVEKWQDFLLFTAEYYSIYH